MAADYGWIIDNDLVDDGRDNGRTGPRDIPLDMKQVLAEGEGEPFKMYDDDDELYYEGRIIGDYGGFEPVDDFGRPNAGAVHISYDGGYTYI